jgi:anti-anti-sigma factor
VRLSMCTVASACVLGAESYRDRRNVGRETPSCRHELLAITVTLTRPQPDTTVCTIIGKIDMDTTPVLRDAVAEARGDDNAHLVIKSSAVSSMDSTGLYVLFDTNTTSGGGGHLSAVIDANFRRVILNCTLLPCNHPSTCTRTWPGALHCCANANADAEGRCGDHPGAGVRWRHLCVLCALKSSRVDRVIPARTRHHSGGTRSRAEIMRRTSTCCPRALCGSLSLSRTQASEYSELARRFDVSCITRSAAGGSAPGANRERVGLRLTARSAHT